MSVLGMPSFYHLDDVPNMVVPGAIWARGSSQVSLHDYLKKRSLMGNSLHPSPLSGSWEQG